MGEARTIRCLVLNGPNLGRLGVRQPELYGTTTLEQLTGRLVRAGAELGLDVSCRQTDSEAEMIGWLHEAADEGAPVVLNPGAWTHYSIAIADAVVEVDLVVEVHLTNIHAREEFRRRSVVSPGVRGVIAGLGPKGYELALAYVAASAGHAG